MKQIKKLSFSNVISRLTRNEMRYVLAGTGYDSGSCNSDSSCTSGCSSVVSTDKKECNSCCVA